MTSFLEMWIGSLKTSPSDRSYTASNFSAVVNITLSFLPFASYLTLKNIVTLKSILGSLTLRIYARLLHQQVYRTARHYLRAADSMSLCLGLS